MRHLILTGVNGCGKTTLLDAISGQIGIHGWGFAGSDWKQFDVGISSDKIKIDSSLSNDLDGKNCMNHIKRGEFVYIFSSK